MLSHSPGLQTALKFPLLLGDIAASLNPIGNASSVVLNGGVEVSKSVSQAWDKSWSATLGGGGAPPGGLYIALCNLGILIAVISLMIFIVEFAKKWIEAGGAGGEWVLAELIFPVLIIILLTHNGAMLASVSKGLRTVFSYYNDQVLTIVAGNVQFDQILAGLSDHTAMQNQIQNLRSQCNNIVDNTKLEQCLLEGSTTAQSIVDQYKAQHGGILADWAKDLQTMQQSAFADPLSTLQTVSTIANPASLVAGFLGNVALAGAVELILLACMAAFQNIIEVSLLLTALIAPIAAGASLLPMGAKPIYAWITGFFSLGMCKLSFNIVVGLVGLTLANAGPGSTDQLVLALVLGIFAPIFAMGISAGGGMALFNGICSAVSSAGAMLSRIV